MTDYTTERSLIQQINKLVEEKTFTADALKGIDELRDKAKALETQLASAQTTIREKTNNYNSLERKFETLHQNHEALLAKEQSLLEREKKITDLEKSEAVAVAVAAAQKEMFNTVFRNIETRQRIFSNTQRYESYSGGGHWSSKPETSDVTTSQE